MRSIGWENDGMKSLRTREAAFADYLKGYSLREVANLHNLSKRTIERWSSQDQWRARRWANYREAKDQALKEHQAVFRENDLKISSQLQNLFFEALKQHRAYLEGRLPKREVRVSYRQLAYLAKALESANIVERIEAHKTFIIGKS
jgi:transposase